MTNVLGWVRIEKSTGVMKNAEDFVGLNEHVALFCFSLFQGMFWLFSLLGFLVWTLNGCGLGWG